MRDRILRRFQKLIAPNASRTWDEIYRHKILTNTIRQEHGLLDFVSLFASAKRILDFGGGLGGNIKLLAEKTSKTDFILLEHSALATEHARTQYIGESDSNGNTFCYCNDLAEIDAGSMDAILAIEVLEHIGKADEIFADIWDRLSSTGFVVISVPVKGWRDNNSQHVNKFTVDSMCKLLWKHTKWVHIRPRSYSRKSGRLATAYFIASRKSLEWSFKS